MAIGNVAITGYCGTGSSAMIDLLREFQDVKIALQDKYEHIVFYMPNGLFDLENKLLLNNDPHRSDEAINSFLNAMQLLYEKDFGWFGSYEKYLGEKFLQSVEDFVGHISTKGKDSIWYGRYRNVRFSPVKAGLQLAAKIVYKRKVSKWGRQYVIDKGPFYFSIPTEQEYFEYAGKFARNYLEMTGEKDKLMIYDHLLWPSQTNRVEKYFGNSLKVIVLNRDPRDIFLLSKYIWPAPPIFSPTPYPSDAKEFCNYWKRIRLKDEKEHNPHVLKVQFEDLIYQYEKTVGKIMEFLELSPAAHVKPKEFLIPSTSMINTQLFHIKPEWQEEIKVIEEELSDYLYQFPEKDQVSVEDVLGLGVDFFN